MVDEYLDGENVAREAVKENIGKKQLKTLADYASKYAQTREGVKYWIKRQGSRMWSFEFTKMLLELADELPFDKFAKVILLAHNLYEYVANEKLIEKYLESRELIERVVKRMCERYRLGFKGISGKLKDGRFTIYVYLNRGDFDKGALKRDLIRTIEVEASTLGRGFDVFFEYP